MEGEAQNGNPFESETENADQGEINLDLGVLDLTTEELQLDLSTIEEDISQFSNHTLVKEALGREGTDLREYARAFDDDLLASERASVEDYISQSDKLISLHKEINDSVNVLGTMEKMLSGFQASLGSISEEIKYLQDESFSLNFRLRNRKFLLEKIDDFVDQVHISEEFERKLTFEEVNFAYLEYLYELSRKAKYIDAKAKSGVKAIDDVAPRLQRVLNIVSGKLMTFLNQELQRLRVPHTNIRVLQESLFVGKYIHFAKFLSANVPKAWSDLISGYSDVMSRVYYVEYKEKFTQFAKLLTTTNPLSERKHMIGIQEGRSKGFFSGKFSLKSQQHNVSLQDRVALIRQWDTPAINILIDVGRENTSTSFEAVFRSLHRSLVDDSMSELSFIKQFFGANTGRPGDLRDDAIFYPEGICSSLFAKTYRYCYSQIVDRVNKTYDGVEILILISIAQVAIKDCAAKHGKDSIAMLPYMRKIRKRLFERWTELFEMNIKSISQPQGQPSLHPHYVTRRYADFIVSVSLVRAAKKEMCTILEKVIVDVDTDVQDEEHFEGEVLPGQLSRLLKTMQLFFDKMASQAATVGKRSILIINNLDLIHVVFFERGIENEISNYYKESLSSEINSFMELELEKYYRNILIFIKKHSHTAEENEEVQAKWEAEKGTSSGEKSQGTTSLMDSSRGLQGIEAFIEIEPTEENISTIEALVVEFEAHWKAGIEAINKDIVQNFTNFKTGMYILKTTLTQLLLYYTQFLEAIKVVYKGKTPPFAKKIVSIQSIMYEIKKYSKMF